MSAEAITIRPLIRPRFENANLGNPERWHEDNVSALARLWVDQSHAIGMAPTEHLEDFDLWLVSQHEIEMTLRGPISKLPHGASL